MGRAWAFSDPATESLQTRLGMGRAKEQTCGSDDVRTFVYPANDESLCVCVCVCVRDSLLELCLTHIVPRKFDYIVRALPCLESLPIPKHIVTQSGANKGRDV